MDDEVLNPKKTLARREKAAGLDAGEIGKSWDSTFQKGDMSQAQFSKYPTSRSKLPPPELMKKHDLAKD